VSDATPRGSSAADTEPRDERARGRELALLVLCHLESYPPEERAEAVEVLWRSPPSGDVERGTLLSELVRDADVRQRADALVRGLLERSAEIDGTISDTSARWRLDRMAQVDRNVLRLAAFELAGQPHTPRAVVLAEAVRLARRYGSEHSAGFVNGVAEALALRLRGPREDGPGGKGSRTKRAKPAPKKEGAKGEDG
jgi:N utilization substance protein B